MNKNSYLPTYAENVFPAGREALTTGKFHDMFMAGDGHELEDYTDKNGCIHLAHARAINSSSMLAYNFFHWVSSEHPLKLYGSTFDKVYFEVKFPVMAKTSEGRPVNRPSNMDVVLISDDCSTMLCIESKYTEHTHNQQAIFSDAYFKPECYYEGNPYRTEFIKLALRYNEMDNGYYAGIKQCISHLIGLTNIMHDADALAWFKANNPFIEPEVMSRLSAHTGIIFTNLLYTRPEMQGNIFGDNIPPREGEEKAYPYLLGELIYDHLWQSMDEPLLLSRFIETYPQLFDEVKSQMPPRLVNYLDDRYVLTIPPKFPLPEGYDTADHYLIDLVLQGANERYQESFTPEVTERIKSELVVIRHRGWADRFLFVWDCVRAAHDHGFCTNPGRKRSAGSIVTYCLGITDVEPLSAKLSAEGLLQQEPLPDFALEFSYKGKEFTQTYLTNKYGAEVTSRISISDYSVLDIAEQTIAAAGEEVYFRSLPYDSPELLRFFMSDPDWRDYSYFGRREMKKLRSLENPTFEDVVELFRTRSFDDGTTQIVSREHSYARCVLFLRIAWLKMAYPDEFQEALRRRRGNNVAWLTSGLVIFGKKPNVDGSSLISMVVKMAEKAIPVAVFSPKLTMILSYLILYASSLDWHKLNLDQLKDEEWAALEKATKKLREAPVYLDDTFELSVADFRTKAISLAHEKGVKCIFVDYIQLMKANAQSSTSREEEKQMITRSLNALAEELNITIIASTKLQSTIKTQNS